MLRKIASMLPRGVQDEIKRQLFRRQIKRGTFVSDEPEFDSIGQYVKRGDTVIDVGANIGHYTLQLSRAVGPAGRVIAMEPMPETFEILTGNMRAARAYNVTPLNLAASSKGGSVSMTLPKWENGNDNFYQARISQVGDYHVRCGSLDLLGSFLQLGEISLLKIDAEGHDMEVLRGAEKLIAQHMPTIIIESGSKGPIYDWLLGRGYELSHASGSPNCVAKRIA